MVVIDILREIYIEREKEKETHTYKIFFYIVVTENVMFIFEFIPIFKNYIKFDERYIITNL